MVSGSADSIALTCVFSMFKFTKVQRWMLMLFKLLQTISHLALFFVAMAVAFGAQVYPKMIGYTPPVKKKTTNVQAEGNLLLRIGCLPLGFSTLRLRSQDIPI